MKIWKKIFSRFPLVALTIIFTMVALFAGFVLLFLFAEDIFVAAFPGSDPYVALVLSVLDWIILAVTVMHAANRDIVPETRIPWILCIVVLNLFGVAVYCIFSSNRPSKRERLLFPRLKEAYKPYMMQDVSRAKLHEEMGHWADVSEALKASEPLAQVYTDCKTEYFPSGEAFLPRLLEDLETAKNFIFLEYFIIGQGKFWGSVLEVLERKAKEGVEVRVMYDDIGSMGRVRAGYPKLLRKKGISCVKFSPFVPVLSSVHNNRDHRKIVVIDGRVGYTGGLNLADEYINETHPFGYWKDNAIRLEGSAVRTFTLMFLGLWQLQKRCAEDISPYLPDLPAPPAEEAAKERNGFVQPFGSGPKPFFKEHLAEDLYLNILGCARDYVWITTPYLIIDYRMREALILAAQRGVDVRVLTPCIPDKKIPFALTRSTYMALIKGGVKVYEYSPGFVHAKTFLADDKAAVVGTVNLDYRSFLYHYEDGVFMYKTDAVQALKEDLTEVFAASALQSEEDAKKSVIWRWMCEIAKLFAPLF